MTKTPSQTRILVTGGAGFLGSATCARLNQLGYTNLTLVDRLGKTDKWRNLVGLQYARYMEVDAFRAWRASHVCEFDVVIALGACSSTRVEDASYLLFNNTADLIELAEWALKPRIIPLRVPQGHAASGTLTCARFIYASSSATYGNADLASDSLSPHLLRPTNPYGLSKNAFDQYAERAGWLSQIVGLKYTNVFGPGCEHKGALISFPTKVYQEVRAKGFVSMYDTYLSAPGGAERDARDFLYVKDAVDMTLHFAFGAGAKSAGLFNIGAGVATRWMEVALHTISAMRGGDPYAGQSIKYVPMPDSLKGRYQYYTCADIDKLRASGYTKAITPIADAIHEYVRDYLVPDLRVGERAIMRAAGAPDQAAR